MLGPVVRTNIIMSEKGNTGHRQRLGNRFLSGDAESRTDEMLLELLLTFALGRKDVKPLAEELIRVFGNLDQVLAASHNDLKGQAENIHDRWIETDTGWRIILGRGLDIFQKPDDKFTLGFMDQTKRKCKATTITYTRVKESQ